MQIPSKPKLSSTNPGKNSILEEDINSSSTRENNCTSNNLTLMFLRFMVLSSSQKCIFRLYDRWFTYVSILLFLSICLSLRNYLQKYRSVCMRSNEMVL